MSLMRWIACRWIPPGAKAATSLRMYHEFLEALVDGKDIDSDETLRNRIVDAAAELGDSLAGEVRDTFNLGDSITDAVDAWKIGCVAGGVKYRVVKEGDKYVFHHPVCPMHAYFTERGIVPCEHLCMPTVIRIAESICPGCEVEIIRKGSLESTCIKAIRPRRGDS